MENSKPPSTDIPWSGESSDDPEAPELGDDASDKAVTAERTGEVTRLLSTWKAGDARAAEDLLPLVYDELRRLASSYLRRERRGHTLQATALVNEAYLRLMGPSLERAVVDNRRHFFAIAARAMRRVLVDHARRHQADKRIGADQKVPIDDSPVVQLATSPDLNVLAVHEALGKLEAAHPRQAQIIEMRFFGGLSVPEVAAVLEVSEATVARDWRVGRLLLKRELDQGGADASDSS
ncbi:MAG: sigma-70 family RNA polymerase sigma factor [Acidobacteriota bacterium]